MNTLLELTVTDFLKHKKVELGDTKEKIIPIEQPWLYAMFTTLRVSAQLSLPLALKLEAVSALVIHHAKVVTLKNRKKGSNPEVLAEINYIVTSTKDEYSLSGGLKKKNSLTTWLGGASYHADSCRSINSHRPREQQSRGRGLPHALRVAGHYPEGVLDVHHEQRAEHPREGPQHLAHPQD